MGALIRGSIGGRGSIGVALGEDGALEGTTTIFVIEIFKPYDGSM